MKEEEKEGGEEYKQRNGKRREKCESSIKIQVRFLSLS